MYQRPDAATTAADVHEEPRDRLVVPSQTPRPGSHEHRRGILEGLVVAAVLVLLGSAGGLIGRAPSQVGPTPSDIAAATTAATSIHATGNPSPTRIPSAPPTSRPSVPVIGMGIDHVLERLLGGPGRVILAGDRLIVGVDDSDPDVRQPFAYDPETGVEQQLAAEPPSYSPVLTAGSIVLGSLDRATGPASASRQTGVVIDDVDADSTQVVWPAVGYDSLEMFGIADGFAFGEMVKLQDGFEETSRAIVIDLTTGRLRDLTPSGIAGPALAQVHGVALGTALIVVLQGSTPGQRRVTALQLVDLSTGSRSTPSIATQQLGAVSETGNLSELDLSGGFILGQVGDASGGPRQVFSYRLPDGPMNLVPMAAPFAVTECPALIDTSRVACYQLGSSDGDPGRVFLYDLERGTSTDIATPGLGGPLFVQAAVHEQLLIREFTDRSAPEPLVYDVPTRLVYRLDIPASTTLDNLAVVGGFVVDVQNAGVWRLP